MIMNVCADYGDYDYYNDYYNDRPLYNREREREREEQINALKRELDIMKEEVRKAKEQELLRDEEAMHVHEIIVILNQLGNISNNSYRKIKKALDGAYNRYDAYRYREYIDIEERRRLQLEAEAQQKQFLIHQGNALTEDDRERIKKMLLGEEAIKLKDYIEKETKVEDFLDEDEMVL